MTAITFRRNSAGNRRQKRIKVTMLSFNPGSSQGRDDKARRIAANIAKLPELFAQLLASRDAAYYLPSGVRTPIQASRTC